MSRTYKDRPYWVRYPDEFDSETHRCLSWRETDKRKKKKNYLGWNWMTTPSWWTHMFMIVPQRRAGRAWERKILLNEELESPGVSNKPHMYFW